MPIKIVAMALMIQSLIVGCALLKIGASDKDDDGYMILASVLCTAGITTITFISIYIAQFVLGS